MPDAFDARDLFDRVVVINLDRRPDRLAAFTQAIEAMDWPLRPPQRVRAIDGAKVGVPPWWRAGAGAWGAFASHLRVIETALLDDVQSVLVFEDDALFCDDFPVRVRALLADLPDDWHSLYLGGQHLRTDTHPPQPFSEHLVRATCVNRIHAYAMRGDYLAAAYRWLLRYLDHAQQHLRSPDARHAEHVDHRLARLIATGQWQVYAAAPPLVGQRGGRSDVNHNTFDDRFWPVA